jgi:D-arabinose 1-dehydrogenase-like Zn-dependent alcohol dehydrogenase
MATMRAARFNQDAQELTVRDVPLPNLTPLDVLVRVQACGICLSDVHLIDGTLPSLIPEVTPGHEAAGYVERVGDLVRGWLPGDRVVLAGGRPCLGCRNCVRGRFEECWDPQVMGFGYDGAWAEYVAVPGTALAEVPEHVPIEQAAILADAVATPYAALTDRGALRPGQSVGLWGIGGLGVHAVQIARMAGAAPIIAVDPSKAARVRALDRGADVALDPGGTDVVADVLRLSDGGLDSPWTLSGPTRYSPRRRRASVASAG